MLFLEYDRLKRKCKRSQDVLDGILAEKEELFSKTQPKAVNTEKEKVSGSHKGNIFDDYVIELEAKGINQRLDEAKSIYEDRKRLMEEKEQELRKSSDTNDIIYAMRIMDRKKVRRVSLTVGYSEPEVYRRLKKIQKMIENDRK